ncbi:MAG: hypothetical protein AB8G11_07695 [Saprospiraceae bacterium]
MRIFTIIITILLFVNCESKTDNGEQQAQNEIRSQEIEQSEILQETAESMDYIFPPAKLKPINESKQNAELKNMLKDLLNVINNKDVEGLKGYVDANIKISFGAEYGINDFLEMWELDLKPEKSLLWQELKNAITLGGTFDEENRNAYYTPYVFTHFPDKYDAFEYAVITGDKVNIRNEPSTKGKVVARLTHDVVKIISYDKDFGKQTQTIGDQTHPWQKIQMADGSFGYVWGKFCRTGIDYRAGFAKVRDEGWKMTFFVAGD